VKIVSKKIRNSARDEDCSLRLPNICSFDPAKTIFCHINTVFKGAGMKSPDLFGVYGCSSCHDALDGKTKSAVDPQDILDAMVETQMKLVEKGLITIS